MNQKYIRRKSRRELEMINHNLSLIIQNQNELYVKLEQLYRANIGRSVDEDNQRNISAPLK